MVDYLSYSSVSTYLLCPKSWQFRYIDKVSVPTSPNLIFGSAVRGYRAVCDCQHCRKCWGIGS